MSIDFSDYYRSLGMGVTLIEKMSSTYSQLECIAYDKPENVVISEYVTEDGQRQYLTAFYFTDSHVYEIENFLTDKPKIWIAKFKDNISSINFETKDYSFKEIIPSSRLNFECFWASGSNFTLNIKTSGDNCSQLFRIVNKYLKPNLV